jgi:hypothetical protein
MNSKSVFFLVAIILFCAGIGLAQDSKALLDAYSRNFDKADIDAKLSLIKDAAALNNSELAPLFVKAIDFAVGTSEYGKNESKIRLISVLAVEQCVKYKFSDARTSVWKLFLMDVDSNVRMKTLSALAAIAQNDTAIIGSLNDWLSARINTPRSGKNTELNLILRCVQTLGELNDESSFPVLFKTLHTDFSQEISTACRQALVNMKGNFKTLLLALIKTGAIPEKLEALIITLDSNSLSDADKGEIAEVSLDTALRLGSVDVNELHNIRDLRARSNRALSARKWSKATPLVLRYFETTLADFEKGIAGKPELIDIIRSLGNMGTHEAAQRLVAYLDWLNAYTETKKVYDEQIVLETIESLGRLGDSAAFDNLMRVKFLNYNATIKTKTDDAIKKLKW